MALLASIEPNRGGLRCLPLEQRSALRVFRFVVHQVDVDTAEYQDMQGRMGPAQRISSLHELYWMVVFAL